MNVLETNKSSFQNRMCPTNIRAQDVKKQMKLITNFIGTKHTSCCSFNDCFVIEEVPGRECLHNRKNSI